MNPSPSAQNPISQPLKKANPSSHFTPSRPSQICVRFFLPSNGKQISFSKEIVVIRRWESEYHQRNDPTIEMIPATEMTPNHHRNDPHHRNDTGGHRPNDPLNMRNGIKRTVKTG